MAFLDNVLPASARSFSRHQLWQAVPFLLTACVMVLMSMDGMQEKMARAALLADAFPVSPCGPERKNMLYLQKSESRCLTIEAHFSPRHFVYRITPSELPSGDQPGANHQ